MPTDTKSCLFDATRMQETIHRMAFELLEAYVPQKSVTVVGVGEKGTCLAQRLIRELQPLGNFSLLLGRIDPIQDEKKQVVSASFSEDVPCRSRSVLLIDDVLNTGRTLAFCLMEILKKVPKQVHTTVLVERSHKRYPIEVNTVGYRLSTTLEHYVSVNFEQNPGIYLH